MVAAIMGKIYETKITKFDGGIVNDPRDPRENVCKVVSNFDVLTDPYRITPYVDSETGDSSASTNKIGAFGIGLSSGTTYYLLGLGVVSGQSYVKLFYKTIDGSAGGLVDGTWTPGAGTPGSTGAVNYDCFVYYQKTGFFYGANSTSGLIWKSTVAGAVTDSVGGSSPTGITNVAQGLVHSKDDILYIPYDNKIAKNNNDTWTAAALTLPTHFRITSICEYGNYIAIGCAPLSGIGNSIVYLWDRDASLATLSESIDWGEGHLRILEVIDGVLVGISIIGGANFTGGGDMSATTFTDKIIFRGLSGNKATKLLELTGSTNNQLPIAKQKVKNRLNFLMGVSLNGVYRQGLWSFGRTPEGNFTLVHERTYNNDATATVTLGNFIVIGDYTFISYQT